MSKKLQDAEVANLVIGQVAAYSDESWVDLEPIVLNVICQKITDVDEAESHFDFRKENIKSLIDKFLDESELPLATVDLENLKIKKDFSNQAHREVLDSIYALSPQDFEKYCCYLAEYYKFENTSATGGSHDDGVDFSANISFGTQKCVLIGQAKRYQLSILVKENEIKKFIGGALRKKHDMIKQGDIGIMTPVFFCFWTTSKFHKDAIEYAKRFGVWIKNGYEIASIGLLEN